MQKISITFILLFITTLVFSQGGVDSVLTSIAAKNKTLATNTQLLEAKRLEYRTGLTPHDPTVEYDYLLGKPSNMGNQTDIVVVQSFDFPTAYVKKRKVAEGLVGTLEFEASIRRQTVLLDAKLLCLELIYLNKFIAQLKTRTASSKRVKDDLNTKLQNEEVSAIEANKAKLMLLNVNTELQLLKTKREQLLLSLTRMNGGELISLQDTVYPSLPDIPEVDKLEMAIESDDPMLKLCEQQIEVNELQVGLAKAMTLPKIETGYHYQSILGQTFNGIHFGISIPLWENKNSVKQRRAYALFTEMKLDEHRTDHQFEIKELYEKYKVLNASMAEYKAVLGTLSSEELLRKSLELGQISFIQFALELGYYYSAFDKYLQLEKELHITVAKLYKHKL